MTVTFAGLHLDAPLIMGVLNVTPDSFSDGGQFLETDSAIQQAHQMIDQGAAILDIGGESTRPGASPVTIEEEINRVLPVVEALSTQNVLISVDTRNSEVMRAVLAAGADIINDVSAGTHDPATLPLIAESKASIILMHMQGTPQTMQQDPVYNDVVEDVYQFLQDRINACQQLGIAKENIGVDVGIGFGKTLDHNLALLRSLSHFQSLGCAQVLGVSRKSFIGQITGEQTASERLGGSLATFLHAVRREVNIHRVHDVKATAQALQMWEKLDC